jgi:alpha-tubulin suppressor-like RCC1 family protein
LNHTAFLTSNAQVYTMGDNSQGQLGIGNHISLKPNPVLVDSLTSLEVIDIACGESHTLALAAF